jgi:hypothetical protein
MVTNDMQITDEYVYYVKTIHSTYTDAARNPDYKDYPLYKCLTSPMVATKYEIDNTSIEKFQKESIYTYTEAT